MPELIDEGILNQVTHGLAQAMRQGVENYKRLFADEQYRKVKLSGRDLLARHPYMLAHRNEIIAQKGLLAWMEYQERINRLMQRGQGT